MLDSIITIVTTAIEHAFMNVNYTLVASIIAAVTSIISALIAVFSKQNDFKNDYYKKIIEKRFNVYQALEAILYELRGVHIQPETEKEFPIVFASATRLAEFKASVFKVIREGFWLGEGVRKELIKLHSLIRQAQKEYSDIEEEYPSPDEGDNYDAHYDVIYKDLGVKYYLEINKIAFDISLFFKKDLPDIHKVEKYLKHVVKQSEKAMKVYTATQKAQQQQ